VTTANTENGHQKDGLKRLILRLTMAPARNGEGSEKDGAGVQVACRSGFRIFKAYPS